MVIWSDRATRNLRGIFDFIALDSLKYARHVTTNIVAKSEVLERFPQMGRAVPEVGRDDVRELLIGSHRLIYRTLPGRDVEILTIIHGSRDFREDDLSE